MTRYLLDTNVVSDLMRNPDGMAEQALRLKAGSYIGISPVVKGEIRFGLIRNENTKGWVRFERFLEVIEVWPMTEEVADLYGELRATMEKSGTKTDPNDMWIAAHSLALDATLVTDDRHFLNVPGLKIENWLRAGPAV